MYICRFSLCVLRTGHFGGNVLAWKVVQCWPSWWCALTIKYVEENHTYRFISLCFSWTNSQSRCKFILTCKPRAIIHENVEPFPVELLDGILGLLDESLWFVLIRFDCTHVLRCLILLILNHGLSVHFRNAVWECGSHSPRPTDGGFSDCETKKVCPPSSTERSYAPYHDVIVVFV